MALVVLVLSLVATLFGVWRERELARREEVIRWQESFAQLQPVLQPFLLTRFAELHNLARNTLQRPQDFSRAAWENFVNAAEWRQHFPGMLEIGYADFDGETCLVKYSASDLAAPAFPPGFDFFSNEKIRAAIIKAAANGMSGSVPAAPLGPGTNALTASLGLLALVKQELPPGSPANNQANIRGFVFFVLDQQKYFNWLLTQLRPLPFNLRLLRPDEVTPAKTTARRPFTNLSASGEWRLVASMRPGAAGATLAPWLVLAGGLALGGLLYFLFVTQSQLRLEAEKARAETAALNRDLEQRIATRTAELKLSLSKEQELNRLKGNFVSMVSHEIRTPLALILSSAEMLSAYLDHLSPARRQQHLETINDAVRRMALLVDDVLLFSRAETGRLEFKPAVLEINRFCARLVDELASATNRRCPIQTSVPAADEPVHADESLVRHILTNLLTNAVKYSPPGSVVHLEAQHLPGLMVFRVRDRGIGIPQADMKSIFTPFFRSQNSVHTAGTGLGLVIVKLCVERHNGKIQIESREGEGTLVTVQLPVCVPGQTEVFLKQMQAPGDIT